MEIAEDVWIRNEFHQCTITVSTGSDLIVFGDDTLLELGHFGLTFSGTLYPEPGTQCIDCFGTHTIQTDRFLKSLAVVFGTCVHFTDTVDDLP